MLARSLRTLSARGYLGMENTLCEPSKLPGFLPTWCSHLFLSVVGFKDSLSHHSLVTCKCRTCCFEGASDVLAVCCYIKLAGVMMRYGSIIQILYSCPYKSYIISEQNCQNILPPTARSVGWSCAACVRGNRRGGAWPSELLLKGRLCCHALARNVSIV